jgi:hypothetical protein
VSGQVRVAAVPLPIGTVARPEQEIGMKRRQTSFAARSRQLAAGLALGLFGLTPVLAGDWDVGGSAGVETRIFLREPAFGGQEDGVQSSLILEGDFRWRSDDRRHQWVIVPWARIDSLDEERTHADLREGFYRYSGDAITVEVGVIKVFWGVTESRHLVDVINQTDAVEDADGEDKLGQPAFRVSSQRDWGLIEGFILPYHRERTFAGVEGRLRGPLPVDWDSAIYEHADEENHVDLAARWSHFIGDWDIGLSAFHGTSREPTLRMAPSGDRFLPHYSVISQVSADIQLTKGAWLWKFEGLGQSGHGDTFGAAVAGVEYTFYGVSQSGADFGVLVEYLHDGRSDDPTITPLTTFDNDVFVGGRYAFNDIADTGILGGAVVDVEDGSTAVFLEAERRLGADYFIELEGRFTTNIAANNPLAAFDRDDAVTLRLTRHF